MSKNNEEAFLQLARSGFRYRMFLLANLPSAFFSGLRVVAINAESSTVAVPLTWFSKNPFRSIYFACLAMAAEMSTGLLAMIHVYRREPSVSMLVVKMEAEFFKKAVGLISFHSPDGAAIRSAIEASVRTGEGQTLETSSTGTNRDGELVARFRITWSFRVRSNSKS